MCIKMAKKDLEEIIEIPEGIEVVREERDLIVKGQKGEVRREFRNPRVNIEIKDNKVRLFIKNASKRDKAMLKTYRTHIKNAVEGVKEHYNYKLKICSGHFPMNVSVSNNELIIKNFYGEKIPRKIKISENIKVKVNGDIIVVEGTDKERTGQVAANIEQITRRTGFDKRIFQDGIYMIEKAGKSV